VNGEEAFRSGRVRQQSEGRRGRGERIRLIDKEVTESTKQV